MVAVDTDGGANSFVNLALLQFQGGLVLNDMLAQGNLIVA